jgi:hypothetical protein
MKDLGCEVDHSSLSCAKVENEWMELYLQSSFMASSPLQGQLNLLLIVVVFLNTEADVPEILILQKMRKIFLHPEVPQKASKTVSTSAIVVSYSSSFSCPIIFFSYEDSLYPVSWSFTIPGRN